MHVYVVCACVCSMGMCMHGEYVDKVSILECCGWVISKYLETYKVCSLDFLGKMCTMILKVSLFAAYEVSHIVSYDSRHMVIVLVLQHAHPMNVMCKHMRHTIISLVSQQF